MHSEISINDWYYVYIHKDPVDDEIVYVGFGCKERAWCVRPGKGNKVGGGQRKPEHSKWCYELMRAGLTPDDWVLIVKQGLSSPDARQIETQLIKEINPRFNYKPGVNFKLSDKDLEYCWQLREQGLYYNQIASKLGVSTMSVWRRMNG